MARPLRDMMGSEVKRKRKTPENGNFFFFFSLRCSVFPPDDNEKILFNVNNDRMITRMELLHYKNGIYQTHAKPHSVLAKSCPTLAFYWKFLFITLKASAKAKRGDYDSRAWSQSSLDVLRALEEVGVCFEIRGTEHIKKIEEPCVFVANHMSMLETMILPAIVQPLKDVTFVVKQNLLEYPVFKYIMRTRNPITVTRQHPIKDFKTVLEGGEERLRTGRSIIVFPQTTRTASFKPAQFNSIGVKLAKKASVPVIPLGLITHAWGNGKYIKDFGKIAPSRKVFFIFGEPIWIQGRGNSEHASILEFIRRTVQPERFS